LSKFGLQLWRTHVHKALACFCVPFAFLLHAVGCAAPMAWTQDNRCLDSIYPAGTSRTSAAFQFDRTFEGDAGGGYSCGLRMRPSELRRALDTFRNGVLYRDPSSINAVVQFPINVHVSDGLEPVAKKKTIRIKSASEWFAFQEKNLTDAHLALVACSYLGNVTLEGGRSPGAMIGLGAFWFQSFEGSWRVKMTAVNIDPLSPDKLAKACTPPGAESR